MSKKSIENFGAVVISLAALTTFFSACSSISPSGKPDAVESHYFPPKVIGRITSDDITESSGIAASKCQSDVFWTHNDSDKGPLVYAFKATGESLGTWKVRDADSDDWEDIAGYKDKNGKCFIYIGDIGDNKTKDIDQVVYRIGEPTVKPSDANSTREGPSIQLSRQDAEC